MGACVWLAACGGGADDDDVTRGDVERWLVTEGGNTQEEAECIADAMLAAGLDQGELRQFVRLDAEMSEEEFEAQEPTRMDVYTDAAIECTGVLDEVEEAIN